MATALSSMIESQPEQLGRMVELDLDGPLQRLERARRIWLVGTGTSQHAAELGTLMLTRAGRDARACSSAAFVRLAAERPSLLREGDEVVVISHTTVSSYARAARELARASAAQLLAITGAGRGWPEAIETVAPEQSETYTVSYTAALLVLARLALALGAEDLSQADIGRVPGCVQAVLDEIARPEVTPPARALVIAGAGAGAITAREGALKVREAARVLSEGYEAEYLLHGTAVPLDDRDALVLLDPDRDPDGLLGSVGRTAGEAGLAVHAFSEPAELPEVLRQIPLTVRLQLLAGRLAAQTGHDPDRVIVGAWADDALWSRGAPVD